ncbi:3' terminal RNA ribose 2'-O-methyltransferase Hen1 [Nocardia sp. NPDC050710]|uniref:3' terminal RNA ribose 2'-O-methyltransferase Hen1 n=1 Tax=Nocardia sp. NPDC050710 TaxID=3157220 RepID=UPI0033D99181
MLLTITCTRPEGATWPATDLGFLLHKNPARVQAFEQSYGTAHVVYPEATEQRCTAALVLEVDPIRLVRGRSRSTPDFSLGQYVNDRPYAASSLLSVALGAVFRTALHGRCDHRPDLARAALPLRIELPSVPCKGGPEIAERVFAPLGWTVATTPLPLDPAFPDWGDSHYVRLELTGTVRLADALSHLYVLLPVLDGAKHYWVAADEVDKLIRAGESWLAQHPERAWITRRYLARRHSLVRTALARLAEVDDVDPEFLDAVEENVEDDVHSEPSPSNARGVEWTQHGGESERGAAAPDVAVAAAPDVAVAAAPNVTGPADPKATDPNVTGAVDASAADAWAAAQVAVAGPETSTRSVDSKSDDTESHGVESHAVDAQASRQPSLAVSRRAAVLDALREVGASRVLDLGCGEGSLLRELLADRTFTEIVGVDVSMRALNIAKRRLRLDRMPERVARRLTLLQGSLTYTDARLRGYDAAVLMEVIEHIDPPRLSALGHAVFGAAAPTAVLVTTPNAEVNARFEGMAPGEFRHRDHRFEWTRAEFARWSEGVAARFGYAVRFVPIGAPDPDLGSPTQMAVFIKTADIGNDEKGAAR